jgi:hypothetical protein
MKFLETKFISKISIKSVFGINELHSKFVYKSQLYFTRNHEILLRNHEILLKTYDFYETMSCSLRNKINDLLTIRIYLKV